jgi:hypothetical protein
MDARRRAGTDPDAHADAHTHTDTASGAIRRVHDVRSLRVDWRRRVQQRRLVNAWQGPGAVHHADAHNDPDSDSASRAGAFDLHDARSVRFDRRWPLRERRLDARPGAGTDPAAGANPDAHAGPDGLHDA